MERQTVSSEPAGGEATSGSSQLSDADASALTTALGLPANAGEAEILAAIAILREREIVGELLKCVAVSSVVRIRELLGLHEAASPLDCAAALAERVPADMARTAIVTMQLAAARDEIRHLEVKAILRDALRV